MYPQARPFCVSKRAVNVRVSGYSCREFPCIRVSANAQRAPKKKPKKAVTVQFNDDVLLPEPIPFENIPIPEPEGEYDGPIDDDEGMALFDAINKVTGS